MSEKNIKLRSGKKGALKKGHPWIFKNQTLKTDPSIKPGEIISVTEDSGKFAGRGYFNPRCEIAVRLLTFIDEPIDAAFFKSRFDQAIAKRAQLSDATNAYRVIFSEADRLPGLIVDMYNGTALFQALTLGMDSLKPMVIDAIDQVLKPKYIYERSISPFRKLEGLKDLCGWWGDEGATKIEIFEGKAKFHVDILNCHKTGFYLDQRKSRMALEGIAKNKKVLDLFCYTGGFSVSAAVYGASSVRAVDIKEDWLNLASENAALNGVADKCEFVKGDVFRALEDIKKSGEKFDLIILDPPSFLKTKASVFNAAKGYKELNTLAIGALSGGGILATFSCSHNMPNELFSKVIKESAEAAGRRFTILKRCHQSEDHPIVRAIPETEYLKGYFLKFD